MRKEDFRKRSSTVIRNETDQRAYRIYRTIDQDPYPIWEEFEFLKIRRKWGRKIPSWKFRKYRSWKHNRKTKWKQ